jgi:hypothetical protein
MPLAAVGANIRIDGFAVNGDSSVTVQFTRSAGALPVGWQGESVVFPTRAALSETLLAFQRYFTNHQVLLVILALSTAYAADDTLGAVFRAAALGRSTSTSIGPTSTVTIGV